MQTALIYPDGTIDSMDELITRHVNKFVSIATELQRYADKFNDALVVEDDAELDRVVKRMVFLNHPVYAYKLCLQAELYDIAAQLKARMKTEGRMDVVVQMVSVDLKDDNDMDLFG